MTRDEARALTDRIAVHAGAALADIRKAWEGRADVALGYESWEAYCRAEFDGLQLAPRSERPALIASLVDAGMSNRAIADTLGVDSRTVDRAVASTAANAAVDLPPSMGKDGKKRPRRPRQITEPRRLDPAEQHELERQIARQVAIGAWGEACDGLTRALSYFRSGYRPPDYLPAGYVQPAEFIRRLHMLNDCAKELT
jgi:transposase